MTGEEPCPEVSSGVSGSVRVLESVREVTAAEVSSGWRPCGVGEGTLERILE